MATSDRRKDIVVVLMYPAILGALLFDAFKYLGTDYLFSRIGLLALSLFALYVFDFFYTGTREAEWPYDLCKLVIDLIIVFLLFRVGKSVLELTPADQDVRPIWGWLCMTKLCSVLWEIWEREKFGGDILKRFEIGGDLFLLFLYGLGYVSNAKMPLLLAIVVVLDIALYQLRENLAKRKPDWRKTRPSGAIAAAPDMIQNQPAENGLADAKRRLYAEAARWLQRQNQAPTRARFIDRPIGITLIGTVLVALATTVWQFYDKRSQIALEYDRTLIRERSLLLKELASTYAASAQIVNGWYSRVIWIAEEANKRQSRKTAQNIREWKKQVRESESAYEKLESMEGVFARVEITYACPAVRIRSKGLALQWQRFLTGFQTFNRQWNDLQKLPAPQVESANRERKEALAKLESSVKSLVEVMSGELFYAQGRASKCPLNTGDI